MATKTSVKKAKGGKKPKGERKVVAPKGERDPRIPPPGSVIKRTYKDKVLEVQVGEKTFTFEGEVFSSLTALALKITGAKAISGPAFFKLTTPAKQEAK